MARRRERRVEPRQDRRRQRVGDSTPEDKLSDSGSSDRKLIIIFVVFFIVIPAVSVLVYSIKYGSSEKRPEPVVIERGLIKSDISFNEILHTHSKVEENPTRHYDYPVLAYITPWNSRGYEMAKRFNSKFTHLSPVWYDLKSQGGSLILEGRHNADKEWLLELRVEGEALVLPRVVLEAFPQELLKKKEQWDKAIDLIVTECKEMEYDGIVLESWSRWAAYGILHDPEMRNLALKFVKELGHALHSARSTWNPKQQLQLVYVIGPPYSENLQQHDIRPEELQSLSAAVDGFSLMTYDFSPHNDPGPNAPLSWIRSTLKLLLGPPGPKAARLAPKIFLGINFFGNDFVLTAGGSGGGAIIGRDYLSLLEKHKPIFQWERNSGEHLFFYSDDKDYRHAVFYPTLMSISLRLEEARSWGTGISIWEIGQGLDHFFDLL
ncbi:Chitinase II [Corchorus olitorius]|uniref:Chitinase domain-containing protein 1 n=1 Tax=Corchorus olitorius TaxID=93759 RepID=A0A1R3KNL8_9ROSI|nr:Chitinase II [Corchorus olitorius]